MCAQVQLANQSKSGSPKNEHLKPISNENGPNNPGRTREAKLPKKTNRVKGQRS